MSPCSLAGCFQVAVLLVLCVVPPTESLPNFDSSSTEEIIVITWSGDPGPTLTGFEILIDGVRKFQGNLTHLQVSSDYTVRDLRPGGNYSVLVEGINNDGSRFDLLRKTQGTKPLPPIIRDVPMGDVTPRTLRVMWTVNSRSAQTGFTVSYRDVSVSGPTMTDTVDGSRRDYTIQDLRPGHNYEISVTATSGAESSTPATVSENTVPLKPNITTLTATGTHELYLEWRQAPESLQSAYRVTFKTGTAQEVVAGDCGSTWCSILVDEKYAGGTAFHVKVYAVQGRRESQPASRMGNTKPLPVKNLRVNGAARQASSLMILWQDPPIYTTFRVEVDPAEGTGSTPSRADNNWTYTQTDLFSGRQYTFKVYTVSGAAESEPMQVTTFTRPPRPSTPRRAGGGTTTLIVEWDEPLMAGSFDMYRVTAQKLPPNAQNSQPRSIDVGSVDSRYATFSNLHPGAKYRVSLVTVVDSTILSDASSTELNVKPLPPRDLALTRRARDQLVIQWEKPASSPYNEFDKFTAAIQGIPGSIKELSHPSTMEVIFTNLNPGTLYTVEVQTISGNQQSDATTASYYTQPDPPKSLQAVDVTSTSITLKWAAPSSPNYNGFYLHIGSKDGQTDRISLFEDELSYQVTGLQSGKEYTIELVSHINNTQSEPTNLIIFTRPNPPQGLRLVNRTTTMISIAWEAAGSQQPVDSYSLTLMSRSASDSVVARTFAPSELTFMFTNLYPGEIYDISLISTKNSRQSRPATLSVTTYPNPPESLRVNYHGTMSVEIMWDAPYSSSFDSFRIHVRDQQDFIVHSQHVNGATRKYNVVDLSPGQQYRVTVAAISNGEYSANTDLAVATSPQGVGTIEPIAIGTDNIRFRWSPPSQTAFSGYDLSISPKEMGVSSPVRIGKGQTLEYQFKPLRPGVLYNISIQVVTVYNTSSPPFSRQISTMPSAVLNVRTMVSSPSVIRVLWDVDPGSFQTKFVINYDGNGASLSTEEPFVNGQTSYYKDLTNLASGVLYEIAVMAVSTVQSDTVIKSQATAPRPVERLDVIPVDSTSLRVAWQPPTDGTYTSFFIRYKGLYRASQTDWKLMEVSTGPVAVVDNLFPGERYHVEMLTHSYGVNSTVVKRIQNTYPLSPERLAVDVRQLTTSSVRITWVHNNDRTRVTGSQVRYTERYLDQWSQLDYSGTSVTEATLRGLLPGRHYVVNVYAVTDGGLRSRPPASTQVTLKPLLTTELRRDDAATTSSTLVVNYTENTGEFSYYSFTLSGGDRRPLTKEKDKDDRPRQVRFERLSAGTTYMVTVMTVSGNVSSRRQMWEFITKPNRPTLHTDQQKTQITLTIQKPSGYVDKYIVECSVTTPGASSSCFPPRQSVDAMEQNVALVFRDLAPHTTYRFSVTSQVENDVSEPAVKTAKTEEAAPGKVANFKLQEENPYTVLVTWGEPLEKNGIITNYNISYIGMKEHKENLTGQQLVAPSSRRLTFSNLKGGYTFIFTIRAITVEAGVPETATIKTSVGRPSESLVLTMDEKRPKRLNNSITYNKFAVELVDPFSDRNGDIVDYTVIVTTDKNDGSLDLERPLYWSQTIGRGNPGTYQAIKKCPDLFSPTSTCGRAPSGGARRRRRRALNDRVEFVVGDEDCRVEEREYCNGKVIAATTYFVMLRAYTETGYANGPISEPITTVMAPPDQSFTFLIAVIVVLIVLFAIMAAVVLIIMYRRGHICARKGADADRAERELASPAAMDLSSVKGSDSRPMKVVEFSHQVKLKSADTFLPFSEEYDDLKPVGRDQPTIAAELPCNRSKNRFTNILPYDHSRVKLLPTDDEEGTDYINASYMPGFNSKREFIVTQGPLPSTRDDFWRMVWEQNCRSIVMLTKCVEKGREKCDHYWPIDDEPMFYGDLQVLTCNETKCSDWILTHFKISKGEQSRDLKHFHYIAWPDFGVPEQPQSLIRFVRMVRSKMPADRGPVIVHCSAGVGRSGTFIALDHLLQQVQEMEEVDPFGLVYEMRRHRVWMVQTEQQYIFIHHCLQCVLEGKEHDTSPYTGEDNEAFDESPTHNIYNTIEPTLPNDEDEGITMESN